MNELTLVNENNQFKFYTNDIVESSTRYARKKDLHNISLAGWSVLLSEEKGSGVKSFILINNTGSVVYETLSLDALGTRIDMLKAARYL